MSPVTDGRCRGKDPQCVQNSWNIAQDCEEHIDGHILHARDRDSKRRAKISILRALAGFSRLSDAYAPIELTLLHTPVRITTPIGCMQRTQRKRRTQHELSTAPPKRVLVDRAAQPPSPHCSPELVRVMLTGRMMDMSKQKKV